MIKEPTSTYQPVTTLSATTYTLTNSAGSPTRTQVDIYVEPISTTMPSFATRQYQRQGVKFEAKHLCAFFVSGLFAIFLF